MSTTNAQGSKHGAKAASQDRRTDFYDPHFPRRKLATDKERVAVFDPHFPGQRST